MFGSNDGGEDGKDADHIADNIIVAVPIFSLINVKCLLWNGLGLHRDNKMIQNIKKGYMCEERKNDEERTK